MQNLSIEIGTGVSKAYDSHKAGAAAAGSALLGIHQLSVSVVLVYASVHYGLNEVLAGIRATVGNVPILGTTTAGEICGGVYQQSVTVVVIASPYLAVHAAVGNNVSKDWRSALTHALESSAIAAYVSGDPVLISGLVSSGKSLFAMMIYPGNTRSASSMGFELLETFKQTSLGRIPVFGGAAADDWRMESNAVFLDDQVHPDSVLLAIFETQLEIGISLSHGFVPFGQHMRVTGAEGHELMTLDQLPAADVLADCMGKNRQEFEGQHFTLFTGYPLGSPDPMGQYSVNTATYFTPRGGVRMTQPLSVGSELTLLVQDPNNSALAGCDAVRKAMIRASTDASALILVHYCALRPRIIGNILMQQEIDHLLGIAGTSPTAGFFSFGEDAVADDGISRHSNGAVAVLVLGNKISGAANVALENKRLQSSLAAQSEQHILVDVLRQMEEAIAVVDTGFRITYVNTAFTQLFGYSADEVLGQLIEEVFPQETLVESLSGPREVRQIATEDSVYRGETYRRHKEGHLIPVRLSVSTLTNKAGEITGFVGAMTDLTSFVLSSAAKEASEARYRAAFQTSLDSITINRLSDGLYLDVNDCFLQITGWDRKQVLGRTSAELNFWHDYADRLRLVELLQKNSGCRDFEAQFVKKNGEVFYGSMSASILTLNDEICVLSCIRDITDRKRIAAALSESHQKISLLLNTMTEGAYGVDTMGNCRFVNQSFLRILGFQHEEEIIGKFIHELIQHSHPDGSPYPATECKMYNAFRNNQEIHVTDEVFWKKDGVAVPVEYWSEPIEVEGVMQGAIVTFIDITERRQAELQLKNSVSLLNSTLESTTDAILVVDLSNSWRLYNQQFIDLWQISDEIIASKDDSTAVGFVLNQVEDAEGFVNKIHELYDHPQDHSHDTLHFKDGRIIERFSMPQYIDGEVAGRVWSFRDVSERKKMEQQVFHLAYYDALTNLPNRRLLMDRLNLAIASGKRKNLYGALMFLDLDNFKPLNDTHGHGAGDLLLVEVATRLKSCVRETDTVARFGGDEFVVMLNELGSNRAEATSQARIVAEKIHSSLAEPYWLSQGGNQINKLSIEHHCTTSVGVVVFHNHEGSLDDILNWADSAMYQAKEEGRNLIRFHTPQHSSDANWGDQAGTILRLNWHVSYECGEPAIDNAHRKLFELANILIEFMFTRKESTPRFTAALENLLAHVRHHFADEEAILARHQYVNLEKHALDHKKILEHALQLREAALSGRVSIGELVSFVADEVVAQHMLKTDREFYPLFKL